MSVPRIGLGIDVHRLGPGRRCVLGGLEFDCPVGPLGHSDGDALLHAVCDAVLGAAGLDDLGSLFPDRDPANADRDSTEFCADALRRVRAAGLRVASLDVVVECDLPKLAPRRPELRARLAELFGLAASHVNVKGKTGERVGPIGRGEAVRATAVALLVDAAD
ncbi:MAG: 2-C-methyl-D-erythritol 2,4-cyclodiphosphate synthase [Planctomycetes bacterium]|nr:2-C-methyl-D-erythritol 2,4-cyclodiphosphate synthase [Planctomycetota bacterium]